MHRKKATALAHILPLSVATGFVWSIVVALGPNWWFFDLFTHFRVQYVLAGFVALPIFLLLRNYSIAAIIGLSIVVHTVSIWPYLQTSSVRAEEQRQESMNILFANIYYKSAQHENIVTVVNDNTPDLIIFAELQKKDFDQIVPVLSDNYPVYGHFEGYGAYDISFFSKQTPRTSQVQFFSEANPSVVLTYMLAGMEIQVVGIHPHSPVSAQTTANRNAHLINAFEYVQRTQKPTVVIGDFNISQFSPLFQDLLQKYNLEDTQRQFGLQPSWHAIYPRIFRIPIDQVVVTPDIQVLDRYLGQSTGSDHLPVIVRVGVK